MSTPQKPRPLSKGADSTLDIEEVVREMRLLDSLENNTDPVDMPLEVAKSLDSTQDPVDTAAEAQANSDAEPEKQSNPKP